MAEAIPPPQTKSPKGVLPPDPLFCLKGDMGPIHSLCFPVREYISTCPLLLASTEDGFVHSWNLDTNRRSHKQNMGTSIQAIHSIEEDFITQEKSGTVKLWNLRKSNYHMMKSIETYGGFCKSVLVNAELVVPHDQSTLAIIDVANMEKTRTLNPEIENVGSIMCLTQIEINSRKFILGAYETGHMVLWDFDAAQAVSSIKLIEHTTSISYDALTSKGIVGNSSCVLQVFHIDRNTLEMSIKYETSILNDGINVVKLREDGKIFAAGCWDNRIRYFSWKTLRVLAVLTEHKKPVNDIKFSPFPVSQWNSTIMAAGGQDGVISLWNIYM
ncbi:hypothetical protein HHI36_021977 [Cryptolaemus montrouzieri]